MPDKCPKCGETNNQRYLRIRSTDPIGCRLPHNATRWECSSFQLDGEDFVQSWECRARAAEAIVAKLPKTADGVPVVPGMKVWLLWSDGDVSEAIAVGSALCHQDGEYMPDGITIKFGDGSGDSVWEYDKTFSTYKAAKAAKDAG